MIHPPEDSRKIQFKADHAGERLDAFLVRRLHDSPSFNKILSRSRIQKLIVDGLVLVDGQERKKNHILKGGENVDIHLPPDAPLTVEGENIDFEILFEDEDLIIVNKPAGIITHPTALRASGTLVNGIVGKGIALAPAGGIFRPGIVHRLDKETSGAIMLAKTDRAYYELLKIFKDRAIEKYYSAVVIGNMRTVNGVFEGHIGRHRVNRAKMAVVENGREAKTSYSVAERFTGFDFLSVRIYTGRTHQIRIHLSHAGHPVLADKTYGGRLLQEHVRSLGKIGMDSSKMGILFDKVKEAISGHPGMFLHAQKIVFKHPITGDPMKITAPIPDSFNKLLQILRQMEK